ncbi:MAG: NAD(P)/FAD-dependent oxidoreductase [Chloroflexi bacterium]|nr:NAD(P)/FAD-dependent oxidoreductase [Chloroflexota bacterium]
MGTPSFDIAIVGGGLAGCSAAISLANLGYQVVLFEAKAYPHHKVCGEFLSPECIHLFDELGITQQIRALHPVPICHVQITAPNGATWISKLPGEGWGISRYGLDQLLADHARLQGVEVCENTCVTQIQGGLDSQFSIETRSQSPVQVRVVIGAHGKRSNLDRALNRSFLKSHQPFIGLKNHFQGPPLSDHVALFVFPGGYCGMSEVEGGIANVCLLVRQDIFRQTADDSPANIAKFIDWMCQQNPYLDRWLSQATPMLDQWVSIGQVPFIRKQLVERDILMAGDAAGLIAPLAGDGMAMALHGGLLAAHYADRILQQPQFADVFLKNYAGDWRRNFADRMRLARALQAFMLRPNLLTPSLHLLNRIPALGDFLVRHTRGSYPIEQKGVSL